VPAACLECAWHRSLLGGLLMSLVSDLDGFLQLTAPKLPR